MPVCRRPIVVLYNLFKNTVMDIAWSEDGHILLACSSDGTIAACSFLPSELGRPLSPPEKLDLLRRYYGKVSVTVNASADPRDYCFTNTEVIENPEILALRRQEKEKRDQSKAKNGTAGLKPAEVTTPSNTDREALLPPPAAEVKPVATQIEVRTKEGKRKITPVFLGSSVIADSSSCWFDSSSTTSAANIEAVGTVATVSSTQSSMLPSSTTQRSPTKLGNTSTQPSTVTISTNLVAKSDAEEIVAGGRAGGTSLSVRPMKRIRLERRISSSGDEDTSKVISVTQFFRKKSYLDLSLIDFSECGYHTCETFICICNRSVY
ncbi:unnamed protein product [Soboliphyme baturini]|uniref:ANAPC4_WD40 domain-containing protein n=1 Tax=Soboliphyme baturini TaxID=241478 RepID=A0A183J6E9_9BILA|nr:unnamed protein product [Soboliphyme baturini]